jgi:hypothetical protein
VHEHEKQGYWWRAQLLSPAHEVLRWAERRVHEHEEEGRATRSKQLLIASTSATSLYNRTLACIHDGTTSTRISHVLSIEFMVNYTLASTLGIATVAVFAWAKSDARQHLLTR